MRRVWRYGLMALAWVGMLPAAWSQSTADAALTLSVTPDNFVRAESDRYLGAIARQGAFGQFKHHREFPALDKVTVVRVNRDTLYSVGVFDLDAGPVQVTLPDAGQRFLSLVAINQDHQVSAARYRAGTYTFTREQLGTRYALLAVRVLFNPADSADRQQANALQDAIQVHQAQAGSFEVPAWDQATLQRMRNALLELGRTLPDSKGMFGARDQVNPVRHLIGSAMAWGGNHEKDALYLNVTPTRNDGATIYRLAVKDVPVDAFWSVSVYDADGWFRPNPAQAYVVNNLTARRAADGGVNVQFGGCDGQIPNCLPTVPGWNYMVRLYRPRAEILTGQWTFPTAQPVLR